MVEGENGTSSKLWLDELMTTDSIDSSYVAISCAMIIAHTGFSGIPANSNTDLDLAVKIIVASYICLI